MAKLGRNPGRDTQLLPDLIEIDRPVPPEAV